MKDFVKKLIRMRAFMIKQNVSQKNKMACLKAIDKFKLYFSFYPKASDESFTKYCEKHLDLIEVLLPGKQSVSYEPLRKELNKYIQL
jgi:hypothetical protein